MNSSLVIFLFFLQFNKFVVFANKNVIVETKNGKVQGNEDSSRNGKQFISFLGIPYGKVIARYQEAVQADAWKDVLIADNFGAICVQWSRNNDEIIGDENCLFLNIYTPKGFQSSSELPVLFFIHGGAFITGNSNSNGPKFILDEDVVYVTINYRLSILGFLNGDHPAAPGNVGLKDMVLALRWVQENIQNFGGDKKKVTIMGESAGSASVSYLTLSPLTKDLFSGAIAESGTALCPWALSRNYLSHFNNFAETNNCSNSDMKITMKCLRETPINSIMESIKSAPLGAIVPSVENCQNCLESEKFISKTPLEIYKSGNFHKVPLMIGINKDESTLFTIIFGVEKQEDIDKFFKSGAYKNMFPILLAYPPDANPEALTKKIQNYYFGGTTNIPNRTQLHELLNDRMFTLGVRNSAIRHSKYAKTYLYEFDRPGEFSWVLLMGGSSTRADGKFEPTHADELFYLMNPLEGIPTTKDKDFIDFTHKMSKLWNSFAVNGFPKNIWGDENDWNALEIKNGIKWFHLDDSTKNLPEEENFKDRMKFWKDLNLNEN